MSAPSQEINRGDPIPTPTDKELLEVKLRRLRQILLSMETVAVAFSGGVDSALLLRVSLDTLGRDRVVAFTAQSEITPRHEIDDAARLASAWGASHVVLPANDLEDADFVSNSSMRCYVCKKRRFGLIQDQARRLGIEWLVHGENADDGADFRPGSAAARELGARSPLCEAGLVKSEIRAVARKLGIDIWDKPASACLASRIPYGSAITAEKLGQIDRAESYIRGLGISRQVRVRHHGQLASVEVDRDVVPRFSEPDIRKEILNTFRELGFSSVMLDLDGYRMGSLNPGPAAASGEGTTNKEQEASR